MKQVYRFGVERLADLVGKRVRTLTEIRTAGGACFPKGSVLEVFGHWRGGVHLEGGGHQIRHVRLSTLAPVADEPELGERYPLFCVDNGDRFDEARYRGPFRTIEEAGRALEDHGGTIRKCRRIRVSEVLRVDPSYIREALDEAAAEGDISSKLPAAWANWDDEIVLPAAKDDEKACGAMARWLDEHCQLRAWICEGDEP